MRRGWVRQSFGVRLCSGALIVCLAVALTACGDDAGDGAADVRLDAADSAGQDSAGADGLADAGPAEDLAGVDAVADVPVGTDVGADVAVDVPPSVDVPPPVPCGTESPAALSSCVDQARIVAHLEALVGERPTGSAHWQSAQDYCASALSGYGFTVERQAYGGGVNVIGTRPGTTRADELVVIAAHYDHIAGCPGADDNASGVAGALEAARVLAQTDHGRTLVVGCWDEEERGLVGSQAFAERLAQMGGKVAVYFNFEMIGYASSEPNTQRFPGGFGLLFPDIQQQMVDREWRGDFIAAISNPAASPAAAAMQAHGQRIGLELIEVPLTDEQTTWEALADLRRSDHASFWAAGYPALMITDTSEFRNPNYHCTEGVDSIDTLDTDFLRNVVALTVGAAAEYLAGTDDIPAAAPFHACDPAASTCADPTPKCAAVFEASGVWAFRCTAGGDVAHGAECVRPGERPVAGVDTCVAGEFCTFWGHPETDPIVRYCRTQCTAAQPCAAGESCRRLSPSPTVGICQETCDPLGDPCGAGLKCGRLYVVDEIGVATFCDWTRADGADGAECTWDWDCADGFGCVLAAGLCRAWCDAAHPCAAGTCTPTLDVADPARGLCEL